MWNISCQCTSYNLHNRIIKIERAQIFTFISAEATQWSRIPSKICATSALTMSSKVGANFRFHKVFSSRFTSFTCAAVCGNSIWLPGEVALFSGRPLCSCLKLFIGGGDPSIPMAELDCSGVGTDPRKCRSADWPWTNQATHLEYDTSFTRFFLNFRKKWSGSKTSWFQCILSEEKVMALFSQLV